MSIEEQENIVEAPDRREDPHEVEVIKSETNEVIQKPKVKRERSEKQKEVFKKAQEKLAKKRADAKLVKDKEIAVKVKEQELEQRKVREVSEKFEDLVINDEGDNEPVVITKPKTRRKKQPQNYS